MNATARQLARFLYRRTLPAGAKSTLRLYLLWDWADTPPAGIDTFAARHVLVLAPHMDDEVIGCGGALHLHVQAGAAVTVAYLTDGSRSDPALNNGALAAPAREAARRALTAQRKAESRRACAHLGVTDLIFFDGPDSGLAVTPELVSAVSDLLARLRPDVIYVPSALDTHPDHWSANRLFAAALERTRDCPADTQVRQYEAWTPLLVNALANITAVFDIKLAALREFASQNRIVDFVRTTTGLNAYRAVYRQEGAGYAEAFFQSSLREYAELLARFSERT